MLPVDTIRSQEGDLSGLTKVIRSAIAFFGVLLVAVVAFAGWSANRTASDIEQTLLQSAFNESISNVLDGMKSVAWWDDSVVKIQPGSVDLEFTNANFGVFLTENYGHDEVFILDGSDQPIYAYSAGASAEPSAYEARKADLSAVVSEARGVGAPRFAAKPDEFGKEQTNYRLLAGAAQTARWAGHIISVAGRPAVVSAITIVPNVDMTLLKGTPAMLVGVVHIDADFVAKIARSLLLPDLALSPALAPGQGVLSQPFVGDDGVKLGYLTWTGRRPGRVLLTFILPLVALCVLATGFLANSMFRRLKQTSDEMTQREARARYAAKHDALSSLPNRQHMIEEVEAQLAVLGSADDGQCAIAAYVDIDRFKDINDTLGHDTGDKLIKAVSKRLSARLRADDLLARFGGDEFAIFCVSREPDAETRLAARIAAAFEDPFVIGGQHIVATASVGLAKAPDHGRSADDLLRHADIALYQAKSLGRDRAVSFSAEMGRAVETRRSIEVDLRTAVERGELRLVYQPVVSCRTGAIVGAEALMRWRHPLRGDVSPGVFIPIAEITGLMPELGRWMLERVIQDAKLWPDLEISLNLSPVQFPQSDLVGLLNRLTSEYELPPSRFVLEITEGVLLEASEQSKATLCALQAMGFKMALDDFGTGYSSLSYLCNFKFDKIKIDRSFVSNVDNAQVARTIVQSVVSLGRGLGVRVVAEGVETKAEALLMSHFGCTELQGYFFSKPIDTADFTVLLKTYKPRDMSGEWEPTLVAAQQSASA